MQHLVSIIIPTVRGGEGLKRALCVVAAQTSYINAGRKVEVIVVNESGKDLEVGDFNGKALTVKIVESAPHGDYGAAARTLGIERATGDLLAFLDDDNIIFPHYVEEMVKALDKHPEAGFAVCSILHNGPVPYHHGEPPVILSGFPVVVGNIDTLQVMVRRETLKKAGGWVRDGGYYSDGQTFERLNKVSVPIPVPEILGVHL